MRRRRIKIDGKKAYYHLMSRTVNGEPLFGNREREVFRKMIRQVADFSGVTVVTYAVMRSWCAGIGLFIQSLLHGSR